MLKSPIFWRHLPRGSVAFTIGANLDSTPKGKAIDTFELTDSHGTAVIQQDLLNKTTLFILDLPFAPIIARQPCVKLAMPSPISKKKKRSIPLRYSSVVCQCRSPA